MLENPLNKKTNALIQNIRQVRTQQGITQYEMSCRLCISQNAYEVGLEFFEKFNSANRKNKNYFNYSSDTKKYHFNLPNFSLNLLKDEGISSIEWTGHCTYSDPKKFFSYRRSCHKNEPDYGRLISAIML